MDPTCLPDLFRFSVWHAALNYMLPWRRKIKIPRLKIKESSASFRWAYGWLDH